MDLRSPKRARASACRPDVISHALASYVRSILSGDAPFDRFVNGDRDALSPSSSRPAVFRGKGNCTACQSGPNFTDERFHNTGVAWRAAGSLTPALAARRLQDADAARDRAHRALHARRQPGHARGRRRILRSGRPAEPSTGR